MAAAVSTSTEGWLRKNHAGMPFGGTNSRRYFVADGFRVFYYSDNTRTTVKGHFDLRNVTGMRNSTDVGVGPGAVDVQIAAPIPAKPGAREPPPKVMVISFSLEPSQRLAWLTHFCSAVSPEFVDAELHQFVNAGLTRTLNENCGHTEAVSANRAWYLKKAPLTRARTPRGSLVDDAGGSGAAGAVSGAQSPPPPPLVHLDTVTELDTPRGEPEPREPPPPEPAAPPPVQPPATPDDLPPPPGIIGGSGSGSGSGGGGGAEEEEEEESFEITVPDGVKPGDRLQATTPNGVKVKLSVPEGAIPGTILTFAMPPPAVRAAAAAAAAADYRESNGGSGVPPPLDGPEVASAAVLIQARVRGASSRRKTETAKSEAQTRALVLAAEPEVVDAATKMQSTFRGHKGRSEQQEASRLQWLRYYMQPEVAEWDEALALAVTPEEEDAVAATRAKVAKEEEKRLTWLAHYCSHGDFAKAAELVVTPLEGAKVLRGRLKQALGAWACCVVFGDDPSALEGERSAKFVQAVRAYDWEVAEALALTDEESADVADSKLRVQLLRAAMAERDYDGARKLAITREEMASIDTAIGNPPPAEPLV